MSDLLSPRVVRNARWRLPSVALMLLAGFLVLLTASCQQEARERNPALPQGLSHIQVPDIPLIALVYLNQGHDIPLVGAALDLPFDLSTELAVESLTLWVGPGKDSVGIEVVLTSEVEARALEEAAGKSEDGGWVLVQGTRVSLVNGENDWSMRLRGALKSGDRTSFQEAYPEAWETIQLLPENPPRDPVAVGALLDGDSLQEKLSSADTPALKTLGTVLRIVPTQSGPAFAAYSQEPLALDSSVDTAYAKEAHLRFVVIVRTRLLGPLLAPALGTLAGALNLDRIQIGDKEVFRYEGDGGTALLVPRGGVLHLVVAPGGEDDGEDLLDYLDPE